MLGAPNTIPVWFVAAVAIVVVLVVGGVQALTDDSPEVDQRDQALYPPGSQVSLEGPGTLGVLIGQKVMPPGWIARGSYAFRVEFPDGQVYSSPAGALMVADRKDLVVRCDAAAARACAVSAQGVRSSVQVR
ncbi:MAG: hypothetical protein EXR71_12010 [Myxococcales bacterium]|nr:hypothetical protein [Myxococcales bacterium]